MDTKDRLDFPGDVDVDAVILEFKGDMREAIRGLLHDLAVLAADYEADVSKGFVRGGLPRIIRLRQAG